MATIKINIDVIANIPSFCALSVVGLDGGLVVGLDVELDVELDGGFDVGLDVELDVELDGGFDVGLILYT